MMRPLSQTFRSVKSPIPNPKSPKLSSPSSSSSPVPNSPPKLRLNSKSSSWCVYLIIATSPPTKTYVGVTTNFPRRLKQHNGEIKGGAKASHAGRPWICACLICGFTDRSEESEACNMFGELHQCVHIAEGGCFQVVYFMQPPQFYACAFESKWKAFSRRVTRKRLNKEIDDASRALLQHRQEALNRVKDSLDCSHLQINWHLNPF